MALSKKLFMRKAMEIMNIPTRPILTGLTIHFDILALLVPLKLQTYKFLNHWMAYKSQHSDLSSRAKNVKSVETYSTTKVS